MQSVAFNQLEKLRNCLLLLFELIGLAALHIAVKQRLDEPNQLVEHRLRVKLLSASNDSVHDLERNGSLGVMGHVLHQSREMAHLEHSQGEMF